MASIAAGERVPAVDANVMRILARLRCLDWEFKCVKQYTQIAEHLVDPARPGDFNQVTLSLAFSHVHWLSRGSNLLKIRSFVRHFLFRFPELTALRGIPPCR